MPFLIIISLSLFSFTIQSSAQNAPSSAFEKKLANPNSVLYVFTGSDWCADCRRLEKNILSDSIFLKTMESNNIEIEIIDFPQRKKLTPEVEKHNKSIAEIYNFEGIFPTLILSQSEEKYEVLKYKNQLAPKFSELIVEKLKYLDE